MKTDGTCCRESTTAILLSFFPVLRYMAGRRDYFLVLVLAATCSEMALRSALHI